MYFKKEQFIIKPLILSAYLFAHFAPQMVVAQEIQRFSEIKKITANWECKWCPYQDNAISTAEVKAGVGYITNDSYKHGDYTGLNEKGTYFIGGINYEYRGEQYANIEANNMGLDSRHVEVQGGKQGIVDVKLLYDKLPRLNSDTARTPYNGNSDQQLPFNWITGTNTQDMTALNAALRNIDIMTNRETFALAAVYHQSAALSYEVGFQRDTKNGRKTTGLALGNSFATARSTILATPVNYVTNQGKIKINYVANRWQAAFSYLFSNFKNDAQSIRWNNAFSQPGGVTQGQASLAPDNTMQQMTLLGAHRILNSTLATASFSYGRMAQNDSYLPYTINTNLSPTALPRSSLDGAINMYNGTVAINTQINQDLRLKAQYQHHEQVNVTSRSAYDYVVADTSLSSTIRTNTPYSFRQRVLKLEGQYRYRDQHKFTLGYGYQQYDRTYQEVNTTEESSVRGGYKSNIKNNLNLFFHLERKGRTGDKYQAISEIVPAENPLLRKYNLADRIRNNAGITLAYSPLQNMHISFFADYSNDDYSESQLGLLRSKQRDYSVEFRYDISDAIAFNIDYSITDIESKQAGSQSYSSPDWSADIDEQIDVINMGVLYEMITNKMNVGTEYSYAYSESDTSVSTGELFPSLETKRHTVTVYSDYRLNEKSTLNVFYRYEDYDEKNWAIDGVTPNTIANVLTLGDVSPNYQIGVFAVSLNYKF